MTRSTPTSKTGAKAKPPKSRLRRRSRRIIAGTVAAVAVTAVGWFAYRAAADLPGAVVPSLGNEHVASLTIWHPPYNSDPPTSGPHVGYIAPWGTHTVPIPKELQVHNLEDGGVAVQYNCPQGCVELVAKLKAVVDRYDRHVLLAPYPGMNTTIALTAWGRIDKFDAFDRDRIVGFIRAYAGIDHHPRGFQ